MKASLGIWIGWLAIILAIAGFFYAPFWLGGGALVLGLVCLAFPQKLLAWISIMLGIIVIVIQLFQ
ncbi:C4-dicarboxylate ABC transporter [Sporosarcina sp. JAI121]|uniref:C4-dicarboxylate ABC transporter n=1 Tax=Sporosarcina sp. JAI121 TaxID=2723064 RepID=UPI0015CB5CC4|nr:C4-dicarboxylate ABC transporter [Sporosarcina sp. JAI121]NYF26350.1 membrane-bound ClpP family serine protease [Sporosarcina sp. JAI121]